MFGFHVRRAAILGVLTTLFCGVGCSDGNRVSGKVSFKGAPVANGMVYFIPDKAKGGSGPSGAAKIVNGQYDTSAEGGRPAGKGAVTVMIEGVEPAAAPDKSGEMIGKSLFPKYETTLDIKGETAKDFEVPADAPKPKEGGPIAP